MKGSLADAEETQHSHQLNIILNKFFAVY